MRSLVAAALLLTAWSARAEDTTAPVIDHKPVSRTEKGAKWVQIFARITDESKFFPQVFFRYGSGDYQKPIDMKKVQGQKDEWGANVPIKGEVVEYYLEAYDEYGNGPGRSGSPEKPWRVDTTGEPAVAQAPPPPVKEPLPEPPRRAPPSPSAGPGGGRMWTWIAGGAGVGLLVGGLWAGRAVKSADDAYQQRLKDPSNSPSSLQAQYDANRSLGTAATVLTISGLVLMAGSVALWFFEVPPDSGAPKKRDTGGSGIIGAAPVERGGAVVVAGRF
jgi:hypothetical protein